MATGSELQEGIFQKAGAAVATAGNAIMQGGQVQAAWRQGFNEIGAALKAFPDAIQIDEPGTNFNPLYSDIAADKRASAQEDGQDRGNLLSPGDIAAGKSAGSVHGESQQQVNAPNLPSSSQIAAGNGGQGIGFLDREMEQRQKGDTGADPNSQVQGNSMSDPQQEHERGGRSH